MSKKKENKQRHPQIKKPGEKIMVTGKRNYYGLLLAIMVVSFIAYLPALQNGFVWDDDDYIRNNALIRSINLHDIFSGFVMGNYHPFTILMHAIEFHFFHLAEKGYHFVNIIIHLVNIFLVYTVISFLSKRREVAIIAALLFGIHPLHVESVAWVSELKDLLYTAFFLSSYYLYLKYMKEREGKFYFFSLLLFVFSLLSKAMAASLPVLLILTDYLNSNKINLKSILEKVPYFILSLVFGVVAIMAQKTSGATDIAVFAIPQRFVFASYGFITYLFKLILPVNLSAYYPYPVKSGGDIPLAYYFYLLFVLGLITYVFYSIRFSKKIIFGFGFFAITIFLVLQLLPVGGAIMADRYSYIPSIGIFYLIGEGLYLLWNKKDLSKTLKYPVMALFFMAVIFYVNKTNARCNTWKNGMTLWSDVIDQYQTIPQAYINRGIVFADEKKYDAALGDYDKAIELEPNFEKPYNDRGILLRTLKRYDEALRDYNKAIEIKPDYAIAYNNRGVVLKDMKRYDEAIKDYNKSIEIKPDYVNPHINRGIVLAKQNKYDEAITDYDKAISLDPENITAIINRGNAYMIEKKTDEAINDFTKVISLKPNSPEAYYNRGVIEFDNGKKELGCTDLQQAAGLGFQAAADEYKKICH